MDRQIDADTDRHGYEHIDTDTDIQIDTNTDISYTN